MDNKYTEFIENYLINDKTKSAIMLVGGWGTGKSYYIQNVLKPYLKGKQKDCIIVSLYGLNDLKDISKAIYLEERTKKIRTKISKFKPLRKAESQESAKIVGKTIVKGVTSFFNIDLTSNEEDLQRLYESLNLSGKLIILEDLERTNIPIKDVLGYVNNLVEQDGVKVLLVANEREILKSEEYEVTTAKGKIEKKWHLTTEAEEYWKTKEKTISDTIPYICDHFETIENILKQFNDEAIEALLVDKLGEDEKEDEKKQKTDKEIKIDQQMLYVEIMSVAEKISDLNLRSLIFACQKTVDILRLYNKEIDKTFVKYLFMSVVAFSFRLKKNDKLYWNDKETGYSLGTSKYPLYKFAHDYIKYQNSDIKEIAKEEELFLEQKKAEGVQNDVRFYLNILYNFHINTSDILEEAIVRIKKFLEDVNSINVIVYGKLANYLIIVRDLIDNPSFIDDCKERMLLNLKNSSYDGDKVSNHLAFHDSFDFWSQGQKEEYEKFILEMQDIVKSKRNNELNFDYKIESIEAFVEDIKNNRDNYLDQHTFMKRIDVGKLIETIKQSDSNQINMLRYAFGCIYSFSNLHDFYIDDKDSLIQLKKGIENLLLDKDVEWDKIKTLQLTWFVKNLNNILTKFE